MNREALDPRVLGPLAFAVACFAFRALPRPDEASAATPRAIELPPVAAAAAPRTETSYELDPTRSTARFLVEGDGGELLAGCSRIAGSLRLDPRRDAGELELRLDLGSLEPSTENRQGIDLHRLLGVHRGGEIVYRATLARTATTPVPGVGERVWLGTLRLGGRAVRQPIQTYLCALPGQPLRLQGHGTVDVADYGLPRRTWFGLLEESHDVTLGLDLAFRRATGR